MGMKKLRHFLQEAKERIRVTDEPEIETDDIAAIREADWEQVLERFTEDMDPWAIDIVKLADRYKSYIDKMERFDLEVPGRIIMVGAVLLRMKAEVLRDIEEHGEITEEDEEHIEEEMEAMEEMMDLEEDAAEPVEDEQLRIPEAVPKPPVKKKAKRKVTLDELKDALEKAVEIGEQREERQETRKDAEDYGIEVEEDDITNKLNQLYSSLKSRIGSSDDSLTFSDIVEEQQKQETIDKFVHIMHLETDAKVNCIQHEWLGDLKIEVLENQENS